MGSLVKMEGNFCFCWEMFELYTSIRLHVGDQIIEVDGHSLVGVTHIYATNILKHTSGLVKYVWKHIVVVFFLLSFIINRFVIGREKDFEKSEILGLIQRSLEFDKQREEMSNTFQQYHDAYYEKNFNENDDELKDIHDGKISNEFQIEILKQCYESLEKSLETAEKEKEHYQVITFFFSQLLFFFY